MLMRVIRFIKYHYFFLWIKRNPIMRIYLISNSDGYREHKMLTIY